MVHVTRSRHGPEEAAVDAVVPAIAGARRAAGGGREWSAVIGVLILACASGAVSLGTFERLKNAALIAANEGRSVEFRVLFAALGPIDVVLAAAAISALLFAIYLELRAEAFHVFLKAAAPWPTFMMLTIIVAWLGQAYLFPGVLLGGDAGTHVARFLQVREALASGALPQWSNFDYLGSPLLGFTGPFLYVIGGTIDLVVRDPVLTTKILLFTTHLAAGWVFFALLLQLGTARIGAMIAAIGFSGSFALLHLFLYRGVFPQAFTILFVVLVFYSAERIMRRAGALWCDWLIFALSVAGLILNHQPHALFAGLYLGVFGVASLMLGRWTWSRLWVLTTAALAGAGMSLVAVVPIIVEADWVMIEPTAALFAWRLPSLHRLSDLIVWRNTRTTWGIDYWAYLGICLVGLSLAGGFAAWRGRLGNEHRRLALAVLPALTISFFLYNPVVRDVIFLLFFLSILAALGIEWVARQAHRPDLILAVAVEVILDVASTSVQPIARSDKAFMIEAGHYLAQVASDERFFEINQTRDGSVAADIGPSAGPLNAYEMVQRVAGHHNMAATGVHNYAVTVIEMAAQDLRLAGQLGPSSLSLLRLLNVTRIVCFSPWRVGCPERFGYASEDGPLGRVVHIPGATPVVFSRRLVALEPSPGLAKPMLWAEAFLGQAPPAQVSRIQDFLYSYLRHAGISSASSFASALPIRDFTTTTTTTNDSIEASDWQATVRHYKVSLQKVELQIVANGPGFAQLSHPWYPGNKITVNGEAVEPFRGALDFIVIPVRAGINDIEIQPIITDVRYYSGVASAVILILACVVATIFGYHGHRRNSRVLLRRIPTKQTELA